MRNFLSSASENLLDVEPWPSNNTNVQESTMWDNNLFIFYKHVYIQNVGEWILVSVNAFISLIQNQIW